MVEIKPKRKNLGKNERNAPSSEAKSEKKPKNKREKTGKKDHKWQFSHAQKDNK